MAKKEKKENDTPEIIKTSTGVEVFLADPSHLKPQKEADGPPARPKATDPAHLKPQAEPKEELKKVALKDSAHAKPQE